MYIFFSFQTENLLLDDNLNIRIAGKNKNSSPVSSINYAQFIIV